MSTRPSHTPPALVDDSEALHRRIHPTFQKPDGTVSSQAFSDPQMSVDRARYTTLQDTLLNNESYGVAEFTAGFAKSLGQEVKADPLTVNPAHALVLGPKTKSTKKQFARAATIVKRVDPVVSGSPLVQTGSPQQPSP